MRSSADSSSRQHLGEKTAGWIITFHVTALNSFFEDFLKVRSRFFFKFYFLILFLCECLKLLQVRTVSLMTWSHSSVFWSAAVVEEVTVGSCDLCLQVKVLRGGGGTSGAVWAVSSQHAAAPEDGGSAPPVRSWGGPTDTQQLQRPRWGHTLSIPSLCKSGCGLVLKCVSDWSETSCHIFVWFFSYSVFFNVIPAGHC